MNKKLKPFEVINRRFIELLESGVVPWRQPWRSKKQGLAKNIISGKLYTGCNFFITNFQTFNSARWGTFAQFSKLGGSVRKGEKGTPILFYTSVGKKDSDSANESGDDAKGADGFYRFARLYYVFNADQVEGISFDDEKPLELVDHDPICACDEFISGFPLGFPKAVHEEDRAFYNPSQDKINMPGMGLFLSAEGYYHTYFHESIHATGHERRLNRKSITEHNFFGSESYSKEELIAELGASYASAHCGIDSPVLDNSASYLASWLKVLKENPRYITSCSAAAWKAFEYLKS